jgi:hypothetical protein
MTGLNGEMIRSAITDNFSNEAEAGRRKRTHWPDIFTGAAIGIFVHRNIVKKVYVRLK